MFEKEKLEDELWCKRPMLIRIDHLVNHLADHRIA
jgi:hypothetical protein